MEHVEAVKPHVSRQVQAMIEVQLLTAMRPGEVCRLRMREIVAKNDKQGREVWIFSPRDAEDERNAARRAARKSPMTPSQQARRTKRAAKPTRRRSAATIRAVTRRLRYFSIYRPPNSL